VKVIVVELTTVTFVAVAPLTVTVAPAQKFVPVRVTTVPPVIGPPGGVTPVIVGPLPPNEIGFAAPTAPGTEAARITGAAYAPAFIAVFIASRRETSAVKIPSLMLALPFLITRRIFPDHNDRVQCTDI